MIIRPYWARVVSSRWLLGVAKARHASPLQEPRQTRLTSSTQRKARDDWFCVLIRKKGRATNRGRRAEASI